jgi:hypothetical protein
MQQADNKVHTEASAPTHSTLEEKFLGQAKATAPSAHLQIWLDVWARMSEYPFLVEVAQVRYSQIQHISQKFCQSSTSSKRRKRTPASLA